MNNNSLTPLIKEKIFFNILEYDKYLRTKGLST